MKNGENTEKLYLKGVKHVDKYRYTIKYSYYHRTLPHNNVHIA